MEMKTRGLKVSAAKTKITNLTYINSYYDFVGYRIQLVQAKTGPKPTKWLIVPPPNNYKYGPQNYTESE
jgi:hypothetical protein